MQKQNSTWRKLLFGYNKSYPRFAKSKESRFSSPASTGVRTGSNYKGDPRMSQLAYHAARDDALVLAKPHDFKPSIGRRSAALYRLSHVTGQDRVDITLTRDGDAVGRDASPMLAIK